MIDDRMHKKRMKLIGALFDKLYLSIRASSSTSFDDDVVYFFQFFLLFFRHVYVRTAVGTDSDFFISRFCICVHNLTVYE